MASGDGKDLSTTIEDEDEDEENEEDDDEQFKGVKEKEVKSHLAPKWPTRVFAVTCMMKLMQVMFVHILCILSTLSCHNLVTQ